MSNINLKLFLFFLQTFIIFNNLQMFFFHLEKRSKKFKVHIS